MNLQQTSIIAAVAFAALTMGCDGGSGNSNGGPSSTGGAILKSIEYGRLVDIYSYQRINPTRDDRRDTLNRVPVLIQEDVLIRPDVESQPLFDTFGNARLDADFRFLPFDVEVGHPRLLVLWDSTIPPEKARFESAVDSATRSLPFVPGSFRGQNTTKRPIPVVPRNAAIRLNFDRDLGVDTAFFHANPSAIQLLEFITPVGGSTETFRPVTSRLLPGGDHLILDTSLIGGESQNGRNTDGMPASLDNRTANIRLALPTVGVLSKLIEFAEDPVADLNGRDANGDNAVIRDFRSGNVKDGVVGSLADVEAPMIVAHLPMGIIDIDVENRIVTINKRSYNVPLRGRIPYVDGALDGDTNLATGPATMPLTTPLRSGDILMQVVTLQSGERVRVSAEIIMNMDVGNVLDDPAFKGLGMNRVGSKSSDAVDGSDAAFVRVKVTKLTGIDSDGAEVSFRSNTLPLGEDCEVRVHYYHNVPYKITKTPGPLKEVSDANRVHLFLAIDPEPPIFGSGRQVKFGTQVDPKASLAMRFSEPMNLETLDPYENYILTNWTIEGEDLIGLLDHPKPMGMALIATKLGDHSGDGTLIQLKPPMGLFHDPGTAEKYWFHVVLDARAPTDMAGNGIDVYDRTTAPVKSLSVPFELNKDALENHVGYRVFRFAGQDEDGSALGSADAFGQFQLLDGELRALPVSRFSAVADSQVLSGISRFERGECDLAANNMAMPPTPTQIAPPAGLPGLRITCASEYWPSIGVPLSFQPPGAQPAGGISEPHNQRGSRLQMTYLEDDFGFAYHDATKILLDIEQMHWAPFNDEELRFDVFDRYTMRMAHADWRPDLTFIEIGGQCFADCFSGRSGLRPNFDDNPLRGTTYETVVKDKIYEINPNDAFRAPTGTKFIPYPQFTKTYTWRDPRLVTWDVRLDEAIGFGGAHQPTAPAQVADTTSHVSSPYVPDIIPKGPPDDFAALHLNTDWVYDYGDMHGFRTRDHSPIALPLLIDFSVFPDGPANGGYALGTNQFHIALIGPCWSPASPGGYYNASLLCPPPIPVNYPETRAHASGGIDQITGNDILVHPQVTAVANGSVIKDKFFGDPIKGLWKAPGLDDHVHWAQADFVRRVSMVTLGFFDTLRPNAHDFNNPRAGLPPEVVWAGRTIGDGVPNLTSFGAGVKDLVTLVDPPLSEQPIGTRLVVEWRGAQSFVNDNKIFSQSDDTGMTPPWTNLQVVKQRGNLLNPFYACEAYRYAMQNPMNDQEQSPYHISHTVNFPAGARIVAKGLTPYVTEDNLDSIRRPNGLLPKFLNYRIILENNMSSNPPLSPVVRSFALAYRIGKE